MIGYVEGKLKYLTDDKTQAIVLTDGGTGYEIYCSLGANTKAQINDSVEFYVSHVIREAAQDLFGFESYDEKALFEMLLSVKGVGAKSAFSLITTVGASKVIQAILNKDSKTLKLAPGVGDRASKQIVLDLEKKIKKLYDRLVISEGLFKVQDFAGPSSVSSASQIGGSVGGSVGEAMEALKSLGFSDDSVRDIAVQVGQQNPDLKAADIVKSVLKSMQ